MTYAIFPRTWRFSLGGVNVSVLVVVIAAIALAMMVAPNCLVQRTWLGRSIRAVAEDREMAAVMGIDVWRVVALTFTSDSRNAKIRASSTKSENCSRSPSRCCRR